MAEIREKLTDDPVQRWPAGVPLTPDNLAEAMETHEILFVEASGTNLSVDADEDEREWRGFNLGASATEDYRKAVVDAARFLTQRQPFVRRALSLYEHYIFGPDFRMELMPTHDDPEDVSEEQKKQDRKINRQAEKVIRRTLKANRKGWSVREFGRRALRDGEQFTHIKPASRYPISLRFIDPEVIGDKEGGDGVVHAANDVATVRQYKRVDADGNDMDPLPAAEVVHTKIDCDSTETRGRSRFETVVRFAYLLLRMVHNEVTHRQAQNSIILQRKVAGSRRVVEGLTDNAFTSTRDYSEQSLRQEAIRPGSILTTSKNIDLEFLTPNSNFKDASPLIKILIQHISAATGFTYAMISTDNESGSLGSGLVAEGPVMQMLSDEREYFGEQLVPVFERIIEAAVRAGEIEGVDMDSLWENYELVPTWGPLVSRDTVKEAQTANLYTMMGAWSAQEAARRTGVDPDRMAQERKEWEERGLNPNTAAVNANQDRTQQSSQSNASAGATNQGEDAPIQHKDSAGVGDNG